MKPLLILLGVVLIIAGIVHKVIPSNREFFHDWFQGDYLRGTTIITKVPEVFTFLYTSDWRNISNTLESSTYKTIVIYWQGRGGYVQNGERFIQSMLTAENQGKTVIINVVGFSASMHAIVPCYATIIHQQDVMLFHMRGDSTGTEIDMSMDSKNENRNILRQCVNRGILTNKDVNQINQGFELWLYPNGKKVFRTDSRLHE